MSESPVLGRRNDETGKGEDATVPKRKRQIKAGQSLTVLQEKFPARTERTTARNERFARPVQLYGSGEA